MVVKIKNTCFLFVFNSILSSSTPLVPPPQGIMPRKEYSGPPPKPSPRTPARKSPQPPRPTPARKSPQRPRPTPASEPSRPRPTPARKSPQRPRPTPASEPSRPRPTLRSKLSRPRQTPPSEPSRPQPAPASEPSRPRQTPPSEPSRPRPTPASEPSRQVPAQGWYESDQGGHAANTAHSRHDGWWSWLYECCRDPPPPRVVVVQHETVASKAPAAAASTPPVAPDPCSFQMESLKDCLNNFATDISKCQFYMDNLGICRRGSAANSGSVREGEVLLEGDSPPTIPHLP